MDTRHRRIEDCLATPEGHNRYNRELFGRLAGRYDAFARSLSIGRDLRWKHELVAALPRRSRPSCLDIACGTGDLTLLLAERYPDGEVHGIDLAPEMLERARRKCASLPIRFVVQDMCQLEFEDARFDIVTAGYAIRNASDLGRVLAEVHRVLRPGGAFGILEFSKPRGGVSQGVERGLLRAWGAACGWVYYRDLDASLSIPTTLRGYPDAKGVERALADAGFVKIESHRRMFGMIRTIVCRRGPAR